MGMPVMLSGQLHSHQCSRCGVIYDCSDKDCVKFQQGCKRCAFPQ